MTAKILSDMAFDEVVAALPSVHLKANLTIHNVMLHQRIRELEGQIRTLGGPSMAPNIGKDPQVTTLKSEIDQLKQQLEQTKKVLTSSEEELSRSREHAKTIRHQADEEKKELLAIVAKTTQEFMAIQNQLTSTTMELTAKDALIQSMSTNSDEGIRLAERKKIVTWLRKHNEGETVRALYGQKMAKLIENGDYTK